MMLATVQNAAGEYVPVPPLPTNYVDVIRRLRREMRQHVTIELDVTGNVRMTPRKELFNADR